MELYKIALQQFKLNATSGLQKGMQRLRSRFLAKIIR